MTDEPLRPQPDFQILVHRPDTAPVDVTFAVMDVYDIAINSMNFGSGFLSTEEVGNLRTLGKAIEAQRFDYQHDKCLRCGHDRQNHWTGADRLRGTRPVCQGQFDRDDCSCSGYIRPS